MKNEEYNKLALVRVHILDVMDVLVIQRDALAKESFKIQSQIDKLRAQVDELNELLDLV